MVLELLVKTARKRGRYGHRDATMILVAYRHMLRVGEVCTLRWDQIDLVKTPFSKVTATESNAVSGAISSASQLSSRPAKRGTNKRPPVGGLLFCDKRARGGVEGVPFLGIVHIAPAPKRQIQCPLITPNSGSRGAPLGCLRIDPYRSSTWRRDHFRHSRLQPKPRFRQYLGSTRALGDWTRTELFEYLHHVSEGIGRRLRRRFQISRFKAPEIHVCTS